MKLYSIGIDPGESTGFAVFDKDAKKLVHVFTTNYWGAVGHLMSSYPPESVENLLIEIPHNKDGTINKKVWHEGARSMASMARTGVNVGMCLSDAKRFVEWGEMKGYNVIKVNPQGKVEAKIFKRITGWKGRTNQHERDAGMLVWGM